MSKPNDLDDINCSKCGEKLELYTSWLDNGAIYCAPCAAEVIAERQTPTGPRILTGTQGMNLLRRYGADAKLGDVVASDLSERAAA